MRYGVCRSELVRDRTKTVWAESDGVAKKEVVLDRQRLHSSCCWTGHTITATAVRACHSLMSRDEHNVLEDQLLHARVR